jgi:hypothetical protein
MIKRIPAALFVCGAALAQTAAPSLTLGSVTVAGSLRERVEFWDWFQGDGDNDYAFSGFIGRISFSQSKPNYDWQLELAAPVLLGLPENAIASGAQGQMGLGASYFAANDANRNAGMVFAKQGFIRLKFRDGHSVRFGRFEFIDGAEVAPKDATLAAVKRDRIAHRLLGNFGFSHVGRSFDGAQYTVAGSKLNFTALATRPTRGVFQVDGWGDLNTNVYYGALTGQLPGNTSAGEWRIFGLGYSDYRDGVLKTDNRSTAVRNADVGHINIGTFGGHYLHTVATKVGSFDALGWLALQAGSWGNLRHRAGAFAAEAGWQPAGIPHLKPWLRGGYNYGSGDKNPNDGDHGTFFQVLPTPRIYARMPFFNMMNNRDAFGELILHPAKALTIRGDVHWLRLAQSNDLWYSGGGEYQPWTFGYTGRPSNGQSGLATLFDVSADYNMNAHLALSAYFGHANGKLVIQSIYPAGKNGNFGYLEATYKF